MMAEPGDDLPMISLTEHPRAGRAIRRTKAWGGILAFVVTGFASHATGMGLDAAALRALAGGMVGYLLTWWLAIVVWRNLVKADTKTVIERVIAKRAEAAQRGRQGGNEP